MLTTWQKFSLSLRALAALAIGFGPLVLLRPAEPPTFDESTLTNLQQSMVGNMLRAHSVDILLTRWDTPVYLIMERGKDWTVTLKRPDWVAPDGSVVLTSDQKRAVMLATPVTAPRWLFWVRSPLAFEELDALVGTLGLAPMFGFVIGWMGSLIVPLALAPNRAWLGVGVIALICGFYSAYMTWMIASHYPQLVWALNVPFTIELFVFGLIVRCLTTPLVQLFDLETKSQASTETTAT